MTNPSYYLNSEKMANKGVDWIIGIFNKFDVYHNSEKWVKQGVDWIIGVLKKINDFLGGINVWVLNLIKSVINWFVKLIQSAFNEINRMLKYRFSKILGFFNGIVNYFLKLLNYFGDLANWFVTRSFEYFAYFALGLFNLGLTILLDFGKQALDMISSIPGKIMDKVLGFIPDPVRGFVLGPLKSGVDQLFRPGSRGVNINIDVSGLIDQIWNDAIASVSDVGGNLGLW